MNTLEFAIITASVATCTLVLGFLVGMSYQKAEDMRQLRKIKEHCEKFREDIMKMSVDAIDKAYKSSETEIRFTFDPSEKDDFTIGGF